MGEPRQRRDNDGLRKLCACSSRVWAKCPHPWHFNFTWAGETYRFSLERKVGRLIRTADGVWKRDRASLGDEITDKTTAEAERDRLRAAIRAGEFVKPATPQRNTLTLVQLMEAYRKQHIAVHRADTLKTTDYVIAAIMGTELVRADGEKRYFGAWLVTDITTDVIEQYRQARLPSGVTGTNRHLELLRALFNWAASNRRRLATDNPFVDGSQAAVRLARELPRRRRLQPGEGDRIRASCSSHLRALVEAAPRATRMVARVARSWLKKCPPSMFANASATCSTESPSDATNSSSNARARRWPRSCQSSGWSRCGASPGGRRLTSWKSSGPAG